MIMNDYEEGEERMESCIGPLVTDSLPDETETERRLPFNVYKTTFWC